MISIIISSYQPHYLEALKSNIELTIGVPYEIIAVENKGIMSICKAYNLGASKAKFPYLCLMHEDINFKTSNWALPLIERFETNDNTGLIGVAGGKYKSLSPSIWLSGIPDLDLIHIIQHSKNKKNEYVNYLPNAFEDVVCLDGVLLFTTNLIWQKNKFDENTFTKFHCYDIDFSVQVGLSKEILVTNTVLIEHFSTGSYDKSWVDESILFHKKWKHILPLGEIDSATQKSVEYNNTVTFLLRMVGFKYSLRQLFSAGFGYGFKIFFSFINFLKISKIIIWGYSKNLLIIRK